MRLPDWDDIGMGLVHIIIVGAVSFGAYCGFRSATATGRQDWCYVQTIAPDGMAPQYGLWAHVEWRPDYRVGIYTSPEAAAQAAAVVRCPLGNGPQ